MKISVSRDPARWISVGAAVLAVLVVEGIISVAEMDAYLRVVVALVMLILGGGAGLLIESRVMPVDDDQTTYVARRERD